jgi:hypothetical protein
VVGAEGLERHHVSGEFATLSAPGEVLIGDLLRGVSLPLVALAADIRYPMQAGVVELLDRLQPLP